MSKLTISNVIIVVIAITFTILVQQLFSGDDGRKELLEVHKKEIELIQQEKDSLINLNSLLVIENEEYYYKLEELQTELDGIPEMKENIKRYYEKERDIISNYTTHELDSFFTDRYPERLRGSLTSVESSTDSN